jgi:hypothetical protein
VDIATGDANDAPVDDGKDPAAVALGRKGGLKGGKARASILDFAGDRGPARREPKLMPYPPMLFLHFV